MLTNDEATDASAIIRHAASLAFPEPEWPWSTTSA
jgi:hypothetical protein